MFRERVSVDVRATLEGSKVAAVNREPTETAVPVHTGTRLTLVTPEKTPVGSPNVPT